MLAIARERVPGGTFVHGDALTLPFDDDAFDRVFTGHFYGHLDSDQRGRFLDEARRVARELIVVDAALQPDHEPEEWQERVLNDGSRFTVYKRFFDPRQLGDELGDGVVLHSSRWFVMVSRSAELLRQRAVVVGHVRQDPQHGSRRRGDGARAASLPRPCGRAARRELADDDPGVNVGQREPGNQRDPHPAATSPCTVS